VDDGLRGEIEEFLYHEAELLDERRFREWLDLFTDDARYWMPVRENRLTLPGAVAEELSPGRENVYFDDTKATLRTRVERLYTGVAWAELPPSRTRHMISNIRIRRRGDAEIDVQSNFLVYRTRLEHDRDLFVGARADVLRRVDGRLRIAGRTILLDQAVLDAKNISVFF
jgi:3-phenylpropionate/cinnamic acid dioxygenase small subunit